MAVGHVSDAVARSVAIGRLVRTGDAPSLDAIEQVLRRGSVDRSSAVRVGEGMNGERFRMLVTPPPQHASMQPIWAVEKPVEAQAAQEEYAYLLARELGIDHLVPTVARRADGSAWSTYVPGVSLAQARVTDVAGLDAALTRSYVDDAALQLSPGEAAQAARTDRQLLQLLDYILANNDRSMSNGILDAAAGSRIRFIDFGHAGRGTAKAGASVLEPELQGFQAGRAGGRVVLDPAVVAYARARIHPDHIRALHEQAFHAPGVATPPASASIGRRFFAHTSSERFREDVVQRFEHALATGGYRHRAYTGDTAGMLPPPPNPHNPVGIANTRMQMGGFDAIRA